MEYIFVNSSELYHHGILGMKWGVRRFQNPDGTLTTAGRRRMRRLSKKYNSAAEELNKTTRKYSGEIADLQSEIADKRIRSDSFLVTKRKREKLRNEADALEEDLRTLQYKVASVENLVRLNGSKMNRFLSRLPYDSVFTGRNFTDDALSRIGSLSVNKLYRSEDGYTKEYYEELKKL